MRYVDHTPESGGRELRIRLAPRGECRSALRGIRNELYRPESGHLADIVEIEFDTSGLGQVTIIVRFERPVGFEISQGAIHTMLKMEVDLGAEVETVTPPAPPIPVVTTTPPAVVPDANRRPLKLVNPPVADSVFAIRLASYEAEENINLAKLQQFGNYTIYTTDVAIDGQQWKELRAGFFATEEDARSELLRFSGEFSTAWVTVADFDEQSEAQSNPLSLTEIPLPDPISISVSAQALDTDDLPTMPDQQVTELMAEAKSALLSQDYERSIDIYTRMLQVSGEHRREALEFLGVALEKTGQTAQAKAEYAAYLAAFPDDTDTARVQQRLAALDGVTEIRTDTFRSASDEEASGWTSGWDVFGNASQVYLHGVNQFDEAGSEVSQSGVLSQANILARRHGSRFDLVGRANVAYMYDLLDDGSGPGDQAFISSAYLGIADRDHALNARVGRQTLFSDGVLGRFDGAYVSYAWRPNLAFNFITGFPVDTPRHVPNTNRYFYGASVDLTNVASAWDFNVFTNLGVVDDISDRQAVGAEAQYHNDDWHVVGLVDYDASYEVLNTGLVYGTWRLNDRVVLNGRYDFGASPFLTTSNALIGQQVTTIEALRATYTDGQIRQLARNRTDQVQHTMFSVSAAMSQRFQLNADVGYGDNTGNVASGGVPAVPKMGPQYYLNTQFVGSSIFKPGDTAIFGLRYYQTRTDVTNTALFDMRLPVGDALRINPRLALSLRDSKQDDSQQLTVSPLLRILYRWRTRFRIELEVGSQMYTRELSPNPMAPLPGDLTEESSAYYMTLGYWMEF